MPAQLTRDDIKGMTPGQIDKAREEGQLDEVLGRDVTDDPNAREESKVDPDAEAKTKKPSRRSQLNRAKMAGLDEEGMAAALADGSLNDIMESAKWVLDLDDGAPMFYEITGWDKEGQDFPTPIIKASDPAGGDREDLAEKLMSGPWVAFGDDLMVKAVDAMEDPHVKASVWKLPLKPGQVSSIQEGEMVIVDNETGEVVYRAETKNEKKGRENAEKSEAENAEQAKRIGRNGGGSESMTGGAPK